MLEIVQTVQSDYYHGAVHCYTSLVTLDLFQGSQGKTAIVWISSCNEVQIMLFFTLTWNWIFFPENFVSELFQLHGMMTSVRVYMHPFY